MVTLVVIMSFIGMGLCHEEFHCTFMNDNLKIEKNGVKQYVWGPQKTDITPITFQNETNMLVFFINLNEARREFYRNNVFNDMSSFVTDSNAFKASLKGNASSGSTEDKLDYFEESYVPSMEKRQDHLGLLVKFFRGLSTKLPIVNGHFYLAIKGIEVVSHDVNYMRNQEAGQDLPFNKFEFESLVGIIKIKDFTGSLGYAIINLDYPEDSVPFVLERDDRLPLPDQKKDKQGYFDYLTTYLNNGDPVTYTLIGKDKSYIRNDRYGIANIAGRDEWVVISTNMIYLRPVCSVTEIQNRINMETTVIRSIMKYAPDFTLKAYAFARIGQTNDQELGVNASSSKIPSYTIGITFSPTDEEYDRIMKQANETEKATKEGTSNGMTVKDDKIKIEEGADKKKEVVLAAPPPADRSFVVEDLAHMTEKQKALLAEAAILLKEEDLNAQLSALDKVVRELILQQKAVNTEVVDPQSPQVNKNPFDQAHQKEEIKEEERIAQTN